MTAGAYVGVLMVGCLAQNSVAQHSFTWQEIQDKFWSANPALRADLERHLLSNLRTAFVNTLQAKAVLAVAKENLDYYDKML